MTDIKVGDYVVARSKHNSNTVIEGEVIGIDAIYDEVEIKTAGHRWGNVVSLSDFTFEVTTPPIKFGVGAVARWSEGLVCVRDERGAWFAPGDNISYSDDQLVVYRIHNGEATLLYPGYFPEEDK